MEDNTVYGTDWHEWVPTRNFSKYYWNGILYTWIFGQCYLAIEPTDVEPIEIIKDEIVTNENIQGLEGG